MIPHRPLSTIALIAMTALVSGCISTDGSLTAGSDDVNAEEEALQSVIFDEMSDYTNPDVRYFDDGSGPGLAPINTHFWRRELLNFDKIVQITIENPGGEPPTASVTITGEATGLLHLWACAGDSMAQYVKDFNDTGVRSMFFQKVRQTDRPHRGWKLQAISGVEIASAGTTRQINSVRVQAPGVDEMITSVSELIWLEDIMRLPAESEVVLTVDTGDSTDKVFLHLRHLGRRIPLESNGDGTFTGVYMTGFRPGPRHAVIDVLSEGTIYDDVELYDNVAWGYPYVIEGPVSLD